jgi:hypothetical protein
MAGKYFLEGHKPKTKLDDEDTQVFDERAFPTIEEATAMAKELLEKDENLSLTVIYKEGPEGSREGVKFIFKTEDGTIEDTPLYWGSGDCCSEG